MNSTSLTDSNVVWLGGLDAPLDASLSYTFSVSANIMGSVVKIAKNGHPANGGDKQNILILCTVSVYSDTPVSSKITKQTLL